MCLFLGSQERKDGNWTDSLTLELYLISDDVMKLHFKKSLESAKQQCVLVWILSFSLLSKVFWRIQLRFIGEIQEFILKAQCEFSGRVIFFNLLSQTKLVKN